MSFAQRPAAAYARVAVESGVHAADPHRLIAMLFDGALAQLARAGASMQRRDFAGKGEACSRAIQIVEQGLQASLDRKAGGELAEQLHALYAYVARRILEASAYNDPARLAEPARLLEELRAAWLAIGK